MMHSTIHRMVAPIFFVAVIAIWFFPTAIWGGDVPDGWLLDAQSTSGPSPPMRMSEGYAAVEPDYQVVISGIPAYRWKNGCGPTAAGMVIGYWDGQGFDDLVVGNAATQTSDVNAMISSAGNYDDYCIPKDYSPNLLADLSELPFGDEHADNSVADFMKASQSRYGNYYGWSWFSDMDGMLSLDNLHYDSVTVKVE